MMNTTDSQVTLLANPGPHTSPNPTSLAPIPETVRFNLSDSHRLPRRDTLEVSGSQVKPDPKDVKITASPQKVATRGLGWVWEYILLALSVGGVVSLVAVLAYIDDMPLSDWQGPVSPNTTVSILATITRASLGFVISSCIGQAKWNWFKKRSGSLLGFDRFDDASRGPWGSFWLIFWVKAFHWVVLGAAVTILLLTFEPFLQAIISFTGSVAPANTVYKAIISRSVYLDTGFHHYIPGRFSAYKWLPSGWAVELDQFRSRPNPGMVAAINSGFYNSSSETPSKGVPYTCPTANCTWTPSTTLAICSGCNDVTSHVATKRIEGAGLESIYLGNWTIKSLPYLNLTNSDEVDAIKATVSFHNISAMITAIGIIKAADGYIKKQLNWSDTSVTAMECALYFCTQAITSSVIQGALVEETIASWSNRDYSSFAEDVRLLPPSGIEIGSQTFDKLINYSLYTSNEDDTPRRSDLVLLIPPEDIKRLGLPENTTTKFNLSQNTVGSTVRWVNDDFFGGWMIWPLVRDGSAHVPPVTQAIYESTNLTATFENVARSLTNWMRDASGTPHYGTVQDWVIRIKIEWTYIIVPVSAYVIGMAFCVHSITETRRLGLQPWKTSITAALTHSVDAKARAQLRNAYTNGHIDKTAKTMIISLEDVGSGLELRAKQA